MKKDHSNKKNDLPDAKKTAAHQNSGKEARSVGKSASLFTRLLVFALLVPLSGELITGTLRQILRYFGAMNAYSPGGSVLFLFGEMADVLYSIVQLTSMIAALMTVGLITVRLRAAKGILAVGLYVLSAAFVGLVRIGVFALLVVSGVSDSTESVGEQVRAEGFATFLFSLAVALLFALLFLAACLIVRRATKGKAPLAHARTPFMFVSCALALLYAGLLFYDAVSIALAYEAGESVFTGVVLPFVYPLIYTALMIVTVFLYRSRFSETDKENEAPAERKNKTK